jgi:cysteinyl-tRNA synthetase
VWDIAALYTDYFHESMRAVHVLPPNVAEAKATDHIKEMVSLVETLMAKGHAYETEVGIYFDTQTFKEYGALSGQRLDDKEVGVRDDVVVDEAKKHPADFVLWFKRVGRFADHAMYWPSTWGDGFPGWHIECSAMSMHYLGETIDIHTGGIDHIPVHHENEIAQSECATGHDFVRFWVHHAFLNVDGEKMSKSKHNFYTIADIQNHNIDPLSMRLLAMQTSYRKPLNFTWDALTSSENQLKRLQSFASRKSTTGSIIESYKNTFIENISEDLNTAKALATVWEMLSNESQSYEDRYATLLSFDEVMGLDLASVPNFTITDEAKLLLEKMNVARTEKDYTTSDALRKELESLGYTVEQTSEGAMLK